MSIFLRRSFHTGKVSGHFRSAVVYSLLVPLLRPAVWHSGTGALSIHTSTVAQTRFLCEIGVFEKNFSPRVSSSLLSAGKHWCHQLAAKKSSVMGKDKWLGNADPSSFSNPEDFRTELITLKWALDFEKKAISGSATYDFVVLNPSAKELILDTRDIDVSKVTSADGKVLAFSVGQTVCSFGEPLKIQVGALAAATGSGNKLKIEIQYKTTSKCSGLQWLDAIQTSGKKHPYVFSQCQAIHARSLMPCQDTPGVKSAYNAEVSVPKDLQALMSAVLVGEPRVDGNNKVYRFEQKIPIPSYLTAIAAGDIVSKEIGPRSRVWAERDTVDAAAFEFSDTEKMLKAAENLFGKYVWGIYDILVLPPSFPYGGMENPCLTFATPTLLAGDKSLANVIAHEIAHSWTGNLVTNKDWQSFWLNEGFTVFAERKILGSLYGEKFRQFASIGGWDSLSERVHEMKTDNPLTQLVVDLNGVDPDDAFSIVPYEKGYAFLYFLEQKVGGPCVFEPFLHQYIQNNSYKSIDTDAFKTEFTNYFQAKGLGDTLAEVDWNLWLHTPGMPPVKPDYDRTLGEACTNLKNRWVQWDSSTPVPFQKSDFDSLLPLQMEHFLQELLDGSSLSLAKVQAMEKVYEMNNRKNSEIRFRWIRICIRAKWPVILPLALKMVNEQGRMKFVRPIYRDLYAWEEMRPQAILNYKENSKYMMHVSAKMLLKDLHIN